MMSNKIPALPEALLSLIRHGENYQLEYKEAKTDLPKTLFDSVCAFSNREGGDIFLGVHDTGVIFGVDPSYAAKLITNFVTLANNKDKVFPPLYLAAKEYVFVSDGTFSGVDKKGKLIQEQPGEHHIIHIHVPISPSVVRHKGRIFDRNDDADMDITDLSDYDEALCAACLSEGRLSALLLCERMDKGVIVRYMYTDREQPEDLLDCFRVLNKALDLPDDKVSGLKDAVRVLEDVKDIAICRLTSADVVRHALVQQIINAYERAEKKPEIKKPSQNFKGNYQRKKENGK